MFYSKGKMNKKKGYPEKKFMLAVLRGSADNLKTGEDDE